MKGRYFSLYCGELPTLVTGSGSKIEWTTNQCGMISKKPNWSRFFGCFKACFLWSSCSFSFKDSWAESLKNTEKTKKNVIYRKFVKITMFSVFKSKPCYQVKNQQPSKRQHITSLILRSSLTLQIFLPYTRDRNSKFRFTLFQNEMDTSTAGFSKCSYCWSNRRKPRTSRRVSNWS